MKKPKISLQSIVAAGKDQVSADLAGEAVILHLKTGVYYSLDPVGKQIWDLIQKPKRVKDIRQSVLELYEVDSERCESDLLALLRQLADENLIKECDEPAA